MSPTTFTSQLQVIALGLKGMQIEQRAHEVMAYVAQLQGDFDRFRDDFQVVGKHIGNAQSKFAEAEKRLDRFDAKLERAVETETEVEPGAVAKSFRALSTRLSASAGIESVPWPTRSERARRSRSATSATRSSAWSRCRPPTTSSAFPTR